MLPASDCFGDAAWICGLSARLGVSLVSATKQTRRRLSPEYKEQSVAGCWRRVRYRAERCRGFRGSMKDHLKPPDGVRCGGPVLAVKRQPIFTS